MIRSVCVVGPDGLRRNREYAASLGRPGLVAAPAKDESLAIVGGGQSSADHVDDLLNFDGHIMAINGAQDWLISQGRVPDCVALLDPEPQLADLITPHKGVDYYVATMCAPEVFDLLADSNVTTFYAPQGEDNTPPLSVPGGPTMMTRAPMLAAILGYRDITLYGADSSYSGGITHAYSNVRDYDEMGVICEGKGWDTCLGLVCQAEYLAELIPAMGCVKTRLVGEHLAQSMLRTGGVWERMP